MIQERIQEDIKVAMKARAADTLSTLRLVLAAFQTKQIEKRTKIGDQTAALTDDETLVILRQEAKKRQDSVQQFASAGRALLAEKEKTELAVIQTYLPKAMDEAELEALVKKVMSSVEEGTTKDFGKIMGAVMKETKGQASGDRISGMVKKFLA